MIADNRQDAVRAYPARRAGLSAALLIPALFVAENVLGGPFGSYAGIPLRYALFGSSGAVLAVLALARAAVRAADAPAVGILLGFVAWEAVWATLIPAAHTTDVALAWAEFRPLLVLLLPSLMVIGCPSAAHFARLVATTRVLVVRCATILAVAQIAIWVAGSVLVQFQAATAVLLARAFPGTEAFLYVGPMPDGFFRVFWVNSIWFPVAFFWAPLAVRRAPATAVVRAVLLGGIFVTYSRGIWLGMLAGGALAFVAALRPGRAARQVGALAISLAAAAVVGAVTLSATGQLERTVERFVSAAPQTGATEPDERVLQIAPLMRVWTTAPLVGVGYGGYARDYVRSETAPFSYENTPYAMLAKLGLIGLIGTLGVLGYFAAYAWRVRRFASDGAPQFLGAYVSFLLATMTNPMLFNFVGMTVLSCVLLQWAELRSRSPKTGRLSLAPEVGAR